MSLKCRFVEPCWFKPFVNAYGLVSSCVVYEYIFNLDCQKKKITWQYWSTLYSYVKNCIHMKLDMLIVLAMFAKCIAETVCIYVFCI